MNLFSKFKYMERSKPLVYTFSVDFETKLAISTFTIH